MKYDDDDRIRVERIAALLDGADRAWFLDRISEPWQRRTRRLEERDRLIRDYALAFHPMLSGRAMASAIAIAIDRYRASGWRFEKSLPAPSDPRRGSLWRILHLNAGRGLSAARVRYALAAVVVVADSHKPRTKATEAPRRADLAAKSGTNRHASSSGAADDRQRG